MSQSRPPAPPPPFAIQKLPADNGKAFTDRCTAQAGASRPVGSPSTGAAPSASMEGSPTRSSPPRFDATADLAATLRRYADLYNHAIPQRALGVA